VPGSIVLRITTVWPWWSFSASPICWQTRFTYLRSMWPLPMLGVPTQMSDTSVWRIASKTLVVARRPPGGHVALDHLADVLLDDRGLAGVDEVDLRSAGDRRR
jgi:hypothetical protein